MPGDRSRPLHGGEGRREVARGSTGVGFGGEERGSAIDLVCWHPKKATVDAVNEAVRAAAQSRWKGILDWSADPIVSSDIIENPHSSVFDSLSTASLGDGYVKVLSWYDNEWGYSNRVVELADRLVALG